MATELDHWGYWSYPSWPSHLDHILINSNINNQNFVSEVMTVRVDDYTG